MLELCAELGTELVHRLLRPRFSELARCQGLAQLVARDHAVPIRIQHREHTLNLGGGGCGGGGGRWGR